MRKILEQLKIVLGNFLRQRDHLLLLVPCPEGDVPLLLHALRDLDRESDSDLFLLFADQFRSPPQFLDDIARRLHAEHGLTNQSGAAEAAKLPPLPDEFLDSDQLPGHRLKAGFRYGRSLVDPSLGQHCVWGIGPGKIEDPNTYLELLADILPRPEIQPWMRGSRIVARVPADFQIGMSPFANAKRVQVKPFSIPPEAQQEELSSTAGDPSQPLGERMQAEVQLAYLDFAYSRFDQAVARFLKTLAFFQWAENPAMEALTICGLGDVARRQENWQDAQHWYECAVVPAANAANSFLLSTVVQNLAVIAFQDGRFSDAEQRYSELVTLKRAMLDEDGLAEALEWQGISQERQVAYDRAIVCWQEAALISKSFELKRRLAEILTHLRRGYEALRMHEDLRELDREWAAAG